jgi:4-cresol dehydrogenase (hydroxylating)
MEILEPEARAVERATDAFAAALGDDAVITDLQTLREFRDPFAYKQSDEWDASAMVMPSSTEEVQAVVRIANEHRVPLWTFSQGRNNTYGGAAPRVRGSILVNLRSMNRVLEVNEELAYAVVEPGVRWFDLFDALEEAGGRLWTSIPDLGWGSVIGNSTEYGRGYTTYGDHAENVCGMEVVLPDGSLVHTGMSAMSGSRSAHVYRHAFGPQLQGLFFQSGLGIVTQMGFWLQRRPEVYASCWLSFAGQDSLKATVDHLRELMLDGTITNYPVLLRGMRMDEDGTPHFEPDSNRWLARFALYGREEIVESNYAACERAFGSLDGMEMRRRTYSGTDRDVYENHEDRVMAGVPDIDLIELFKIPYGEDTAHLDFSPVGPLVGEEVVETADLVRSLYEETGQQYFSGLLMSPRSVIHISTTFFDPHDEDQTRTTYENYASMVKLMAGRGYPVYRTSLSQMDLVSSQFDRDDHALMRLNEKLKDALDPNGILQPGKSGIWHRRYRGDA